MQPYAGFWFRFLALIYDYFALCPFWFLGIWMLSQSKEMAVIGLWVNYLSFPLYMVALHANRGQSLGKIATDLRVERMDGGPLRWHGALIRFTPLIMSRLFFGIVMTKTIGAIPDSQFADASLSEKCGLVVDYLDVSWIYASSAFRVWILAEIVTLIVSKRKRAIHDFLASTVVRRQLRAVPE